MQKGALCADTVIGQGHTTAWKMCGLDRSTCLTVFFDLSPSERSNQQGTTHEQLYIQFVTKYGGNPFYFFFFFWGGVLSSYAILFIYWVTVNFNSKILCACSYQNAEGQMRIRVTTITRKWLDISTNAEVSHAWPM